ncbi:MAG TPA: META domain-containing protein [Casimicrobiaceae bacterium]
MNRTPVILFAGAFALSACAAAPNPVPAPDTVPSYFPANSVPPAMTSATNEIVGPIWQWLRTQRAGEPGVAPDAPDRYTVAFQPGGRVDVRADCNRGSGSYEVNGADMKLGPVALTKMACPPESKDSVFLRALAQTRTYAFGPEGLVLTLGDGSVMRFRPAR